MLRWHRRRQYWRTFLTLGAGIVLLSAIRQTRQVVIPLWAAHIGLSPTTSSIIYGVAGGIDALTFYPAGKVIDQYGRRWVAVPCVIILGLSFILMPLTHAAVTLACTAMIMGFGNGIGSGIVMTLGADIFPSIGRPTFLGIWRELADAGQGIGPVALSAVTAAVGLGPASSSVASSASSLRPHYGHGSHRVPVSPTRKPRRRTGPHNSPTKAQAQPSRLGRQAGKQAVDAAHLRVRARK